MLVLLELSCIAKPQHRYQGPGPHRSTQTMRERCSHLDTSTSMSTGRRPDAIEYAVMYALPSTASRPSTAPAVASKLRRVMTWNSCSTCKGGYSANDGPPSTICPQSKGNPMHIILATSATHVRIPTCNASALKTPDKRSSMRASSGSTSCTSRRDKRCLPR